MNLWKVLRIARWEVTKNAGGVDRRTLVVAGVAVVVAALVAPFAATQGIALDAGIYRVGVTEGNPYYSVVDADPTFVAKNASLEAFEEGDIDVLIRGGSVTAVESQKGRAAMEELRSSVKQYNDAQMRQEPNQSAAFPVGVDLEYAEREGVRDVIAPGAGQTTPTPGGGDGGDSTDGAGGTDSDRTGGGTDSDRTGGDGTGATSTDSGDGSPGGSGGEAGGTGGDQVSGGGGGNIGGIAGSLASTNATGTPGDISPPFPFQSLVLAFLFLLPMNFVIQAYGSTMLSERLKRRGELLLVSPVTRFDIIGGKTLPYFTAAISVVAVIAVGLEYPSVDPVTVLTSLLAVMPIALLFLSATFLGAMFARSFKELTFVTVTVTVSLTTYAFVPAIFTDVGAIALISPLTIVVRNLQDQAVTLGEFAFSTVPPLLTAGVLFALGGGLYREEDMFTQRPIPLKVLDSLAARVHGKWSVGLLSALLLPFVFVAELVGVAMLFAIPPALSVPVILAIVAIIEEVAKSLHIYAGYVHSRFEAGIVTALIIGAASGAGFFVGEKLTLLAQLVGLPELAVGRAALATGTGTPSIPLVLAFLFAPLLLHTVTAAISAVGASRSRRSYAVAISVAIVVHFAYNLTVVNIGGGF